MLWTEKYRPSTLEEIIGQDRVVSHLASFARDRSVPHLLLTGRHGTGKTSAIECFARLLYGESWQSNTSVFQTADLFSAGKAYLEQDERYAHLYQKSESLLTNFKHIIREYAAMRPLDAPFKLMVFEDAHALPREAQQALRRIMERTSDTCRFILSTTRVSAILPAISSRCLPLFFSPVDSGTMQHHLARIRMLESQRGGVRQCPDEHLELIIHASRGDLRRAILLLELTMRSGISGDFATIGQSETETVAGSALVSIRNGELQTAVKELESLMIDYGLSGGEVLSEIRPVIRREFNDPRLAAALAQADIRLLHCNNEYLQIGCLVTDMKDVLS